MRRILWIALAVLATACGGEAMAPAKSGGYLAMESSADSDHDGVREPMALPPSPAAPMGSPPPPPPQRPDDRLALADGPVPRAPEPTPGAASGSKRDAASSASVAQGPMLIYSADVTVAVFEVARAIAQIEDIAREVGGFLAKRDDMSITIRVPVTRFDDAMGRVTKTGDVLHRNVSVEDVTEEWTNLEVRLKNARAIRDRLEQLLARATKVEESLQIERELGRVAGEIEQIEGRMKFLRDRAQFSTIRVLFQSLQIERPTPNRPELPVPWLQELGLHRLLAL